MEEATSSSEGERMISYADHLAAVAAARAEERGKCQDKVWNFDRGYEQGQRDALAGAVQRVASLDEAVPFSSDVDTLLSLSEVIAAIKGDSEPFRFAARVACIHKFEVFDQIDGGKHAKCVLCGFKEGDSDE